MVFGDEKMRLRTSSFILGFVCILALSGCGAKTPSWIPNPTLLDQFAAKNPETDNAESRQLLLEFMKSAVTLNGKDQPSVEEANQRRRVGFGTLRAYFVKNMPSSDGLNICFPADYRMPSRGEFDNLQFALAVAQECRLIQQNGPSVQKLRKDPFVAKYIGSDGNLVASGDLDLMHQEIHDATNSREPKDEKQFRYGNVLSQIQMAWPTT
jgi:hypothetical protein